MTNSWRKFKSIIELLSIGFLAYYGEVSLLSSATFICLRLIKNLVLKDFRGARKQPFVALLLVFIFLKVFLIDENQVVSVGLDEVIIPYVILPLMLSLEGILLISALQRSRRVKARSSKRLSK